MEKELRAAVGDKVVEEMKATAKKLSAEGKSPDQIKAALNEKAFKAGVNGGIVDAVAPPVATAATTALVG